MNKQLVFILLTLCAAAQGQVLSPASPASAVPAASTASRAADAERARINGERSRLEAGFTREEIACYKKFMVNNCLDEIKPRRRLALADLKRQEIALDEQDRKARAADQIRKTEEKSSLEKQQEAADRRGQSLKDFDSRLEREKEKNADRESAKANEKGSLDSAADRARSNQEKASSRGTKQAATAEEVRKFREREDKARERQARYERDKAARTGPAAKPLPQPE